MTRQLSNERMSASNGSRKHYYYKLTLKTLLLSAEVTVKYAPWKARIQRIIQLTSRTQNGIYIYIYIYIRLI